jgi:hypothetical protein
MHWSAWCGSCAVNAEYLRWLRQLPCNGGSRRRSWVGVYTVDDGFESFEAWQARIIERDASRGVLARWKQWMN